MFNGQTFLLVVRFLFVMTIPSINVCNVSGTSSRLPVYTSEFEEYVSVLYARDVMSSRMIAAAVSTILFRSASGSFLLSEYHISVKTRFAVPKNQTTLGLPGKSVITSPSPYLSRNFAFNVLVLQQSTSVGRFSRTFFISSLMEYWQSSFHSIKLHISSNA